MYMKPRLFWASACPSAAAFLYHFAVLFYELALISRNPIFTALHQAMVEWLTRQRTVSLRGDGVDRLAYQSHRRICEAVAAGAPDRAEAAMRQHLLEVADHYWKNVEGDT